MLQEACCLVLNAISLSTKPSEINLLTVNTKSATLILTRKSRSTV